MNSAKIKAIMNLINDMDDDMLKGVDMKDKMENSKMEPDAAKVKITKVAMMPKPMEEESEEESEGNDDMPSLEKILPKEGDEDDPLAKLRKKFQGK